MSILAPLPLKDIQNSSATTRSQTSFSPRSTLSPRSPRNPNISLLRAEMTLNRQEALNLKDENEKIEKEINLLVKQSHSFKHKIKKEEERRRKKMKEEESKLKIKISTLEDQLKLETNIIKAEKDNKRHDLLRPTTNKINEIKDSNYSLSSYLNEKKENLVKFMDDSHHSIRNMILGQDTTSDDYKIRNLEQILEKAFNAMPTGQILDSFPVKKSCQIDGLISVEFPEDPSTENENYIDNYS
ncbi:hypothetical protein TRFO_11529 [Tritrichomonas foetus]|uniref:Uncharacterized protein n=1 Tax=Tritrichomonas foetus TaxID=1144522 RepID=A0A1J4J2S2_9EUKA|nr:hypothetical protein TRFO_11529 [Tritrichomonas foetus]|eukprot:OHS93752.1 hypothetical protein TRFO_11529 [Tritrichomonas foetus]